MPLGAGIISPHVIIFRTRCRCRFRCARSRSHLYGRSQYTKTSYHPLAWQPSPSFNVRPILFYTKAFKLLNYYSPTSSPMQSTDLNLKKKNTSHDKVSAIMRAQRDHLRIKYGMRDDDDRAMEKKPHKV